MFKGYNTGAKTMPYGCESLPIGNLLFQDLVYLAQENNVYFTNACTFSAMLLSHSSVM